ncbi:MAG: transglycosylase SLT domain-containing protein [Vicinamibacterales bacterium]|jgi:soluble lytic murein transglycosylase|nr:transglycosylase SLT domain-containing protein [Vicinamibacterales bacterium]MDP7671003.1 transglycosylase SLT domain-containing protein [Vicinamibacterales bacterium]HJO38752.1 transglycosylase SLT domain-containing protein [Vicinamibacterales bacterium]
MRPAARTSGVVASNLAISAVIGVASALGQPATELRLPTGLFLEATQRLEEGDHVAALAALDRSVVARSEEPVAAQLLRAQIHSDTGRIAESESLWLAVADTEPSLRRFALARLVDATVARGAADMADTHLTALTDGRAGRDDLPRLLAVADTLRDAGRVDRAGVRYRQVLGFERRGTTADRARLGLAAVHEAAGEVDRALALHRDTQLQFRSSAAFVTARAAEDRLDPRRSLAPLTADHYADLSQRLRRSARYRTALELLDEWAEVHSGSTDPSEIDLERVETLYAMRSNDAAIAACTAFASHYPSHRQLPRVRLVRFRLAVRLGRTEEVRALGGDLWQGRVPGAPLSIRRDTGTLLAAYLVAVGRVDEGLDVYRELFRITQSAGDQRTVLWRAGVAALQAGQLERAATNLRSLVRRGPTGELAPAALYWLAVAEQRLGRTDAALDALRSLTTRFTYHYYGVRGAERLADASLTGDGTAQRRDRSTFPTLSLTDGSRRAPELAAATALARAGLARDAADLLWDLLERHSRDQGLALLTARALATSGDYGRASRVVANHFGEFLRRPADAMPDDFWQLVYPRPFRPDVEAAAAANDLDPLVLYAIMRQESRFDPRARSAVGALGLFQIMPYTAAALGPRVGVGDVSDDEAAMLEPRVNAAIGARLAGTLLGMFDGQLAPVAASYNAGEDLAEVWWRAADGLREDYFVDAIPYSETRRFVREVLTNYDSYRRLYAAGRE